MNHTEYIYYKVQIWSYEDPRNWTLLENLTTHSCNETDKNFFSQVGWPNGLDAKWSFYFCLDNPEKIELKTKENGDKIYIEIFAPYCEGINCQTKNETENWKK